MSDPGWGYSGVRSICIGHATHWGDSDTLHFKTQQDSNNKNRLSIDADQFKTTIKNFENLSSTISKVPKKSTQISQSYQQTTTQNTQTNSQKTKFNVGSNQKISPKPKAIARPYYKHSTPSPQQEGICTSSESETDSDEEVNVDDVEEVEVGDEEQEDTLEDLTKSTSETTIPNRRHLRSNWKTSTNL